MIVTVLRTATSQWSAHRTGRIGAALAYYSVFSLGPLLLIVTSIAGLFFGGDGVRGSLVAQLRSLLGNRGAEAVEAVLVGASSEQSARRRLSLRRLKQSTLRSLTWIWAMESLSILSLHAAYPSHWRRAIVTGLGMVSSPTLFACENPLRRNRCSRRSKRFFGDADEAK